MDAPAAGGLNSMLTLLVDLWPLFFFLGSMVVSATLLFLHSRFISRRDCTAIRKIIRDKQEGVEKQQDLEANRLLGVETTLKNLPTSTNLAALELTIERLTGRVRELEAVVAGQRDLMRRVEFQLDRVDSYLREYSK